MGAARAPAARIGRPGELTSRRSRHTDLFSRLRTVQNLTFRGIPDSMRLDPSTGEPVVKYLVVQTLSTRSVALRGAQPPGACGARDGWFDLSALCAQARWRTTADSSYPAA